MTFLMLECDTWELFKLFLRPHFSMTKREIVQHEPRIWKRWKIFFENIIMLKTTIVSIRKTGNITNLLIVKWSVLWNAKTYGFSQPAFRTDIWTTEIVQRYGYSPHYKIKFLEYFEMKFLLSNSELLIAFILIQPIETTLISNRQSFLALWSKISNWEKLKNSRKTKFHYRN